MNGNRARRGQGLLTPIRKPGEIVGVLAEYRPLSALRNRRGSERIRLLTRAVLCGETLT